MNRKIRIISAVFILAALVSIMGCRGQKTDSEREAADNFNASDETYKMSAEILDV